LLIYRRFDPVYDLAGKDSQREKLLKNVSHPNKKYRKRRYSGEQRADKYGDAACIYSIDNVEDKI